MSRELVSVPPGELTAFLASLNGNGRRPSLRERLVARRAPQVPEFSALNGIYPWQDRTAEEWGNIATRSEAARLFYVIAEKEAVQDTELESMIDQYHLGVAYSHFFGSNAVALNSEIENFQKSRDDYKQNQDTQSLAHAATIIGNPDLIVFLRQIKQVRKESISKKEGEKPGSYGEEAGDRLGLDERHHAFLTDQYQALVTDFIPYIKRFRYKYSRNTSREREDGEAIAMLRMNEALVRYYWEPAVIDPEWTIDRFIATARASDYDNEAQHFDTKMSEVHDEIIMQMLPSSHAVEEPVLDLLEAGEVFDRIRSSILDPQSADIFIHTTFGGYTSQELADRYGVDRSDINARLQSVRETLAEQVPDAMKGKEIKKPLAKRTFWDELGSQREKYMRLLERSGQRLIGFHFDLLSMTLHLAEDDRNGTINAVAREYPYLRVETVRRQITKAINILENVEAYERKNSNSGMQEKGAWERDAARMRYLSSQPEFWSNISERWQEIIREYYLDAEERLSMERVGDTVGIHGCNISRNLMLIKQFSSRYEHDHRGTWQEPTKHSSVQNKIPDIDMLREKIRGKIRHLLAVSQETPAIWNQLPQLGKSLVTEYYSDSGDPQEVRARLCQYFDLNEEGFYETIQDTLQKANSLYRMRHMLAEESNMIIPAGTATIDADFQFADGNMLSNNKQAWLLDELLQGSSKHPVSTASLMSAINDGEDPDNSQSFRSALHNLRKKLLNYGIVIKHSWEHEGYYIEPTAHTPDGALMRQAVYLDKENMPIGKGEWEDVIR